MKMLMMNCVVFALILLWGGCLSSQEDSFETGLDRHKRAGDSAADDELLKQAMKKISDMLVQKIPSKMEDLNIKITSRILDKLGKIKYHVPDKKTYVTAEQLQVGTAVAQGQGIAIMKAGDRYEQQVAAAFFVFEILKMGLAFADVGGYGKMGTLEEFKNIKKGLDDFLDKKFRSEGATYPSVVGPLDKLSKKDFEQKIREHIIDAIKPENNDPLVDVMRMNLQQAIKDGKIQSSDINSQKMKQYEFFVDIDKLLSRAMDSVCKQQGGKIVKVRTENRCSYKDKSTCESSYNLPLSSGDVYAEYKNSLAGGTCVHASYALRAICTRKKIGYNTDSGMCAIDAIYCKSKGADWAFNKNIGENDCTISTAQDLLETVFGATILRGLKQIFDPKQYEPCVSNEIDDVFFCRNVTCPKGEELWGNGLLCYKKCREGFHPFGCCVCSPDCEKDWIDDGATCRLAGRCSPDTEHQGSLCYKKCKDGYKGVGPVCYQNCASGYNDKGVFCLKSMNTYAKKSRPADKKPCPNDLRDDGVSCWKDAYGRGTGRVPDKKKCPPKHRDDGTSCWLDSYGRGAGRTPDKSPCPHGLRDDGVSCWSDPHIYWKNCWDGCPHGYHNDGCTCRKVNIGIKVYLWQRQRCHHGEERHGALCYPKCAPGYHASGCCICSPNGGPGIRVTLAQRQYCRSNEERNGALCYPKCKEGYHPVGCCVCTPNEGAGIKVPLSKRLYCKDNENLVAGICYEKCEEGLTDDGLFCRDSYTKKSYGRGTGSPDTQIKQKSASYGRGIGRIAKFSIRTKQRKVPFST